MLFSGFSAPESTTLYPFISRKRTILGHKSGDFPVTEKVASEIVSLPMFPNLSAAQQTRVVRAILRFISERCEQTVLSGSSRTA